MDRFRRHLGPRRLNRRREIDAPLGEVAGVLVEKVDLVALEAAAEEYPADVLHEFGECVLVGPGLESSVAGNDLVTEWPN